MQGLESIKIIDFGGAQYYEEGKVVRSLFGTREYAVRCVVLGAEVPGHCQLTPTLIVCW